MGKRIDVNTLPDNFTSGQILTDEDVNRIIAVLRTGVNANKDDLDKLLMGKSTEFVFNTKNLADKYLETATPEDGQIAFVMSDGDLQDTIYMYSYSSETHSWVFKDYISVLEAYQVSKSMDGRVTANQEAINKLKEDIENGEVVAYKALRDSNGNIIVTTYATLTYLQTELAKKSDVGHKHSTSDVIGLDDALGGKVDKIQNHTLVSVEEKTQITINKNNITNLQNNKIDKSEKGVANGVATLDTSGKVPASQLPSFVDDVLEYNTLAQFPAIGETGKVYVDKQHNKTYRWSGTSYVVIGSDLALGETSSTAYSGDKGKANRDDINAILNGTKQVGDAIKALRDSEGNIIKDTYTTKNEFNQKTNEIKNDVATKYNELNNNKADKSQITTINNILSNKVDKVSGKSLVSDSDIAQITTNKNNIANLQNDVNALNNDINVLNSKITVVEGELDERYTKTEIDNMLQNVQPVIRGTYIDETTFEVDGVPIEEFDPLAIYISGSTTYRWSGTQLVNTTSSLALGETSQTAYAGNKGKANRDDINAILDGSKISKKAEQDKDGNPIHSTYATNAKVDSIQIDGISLVGGKTLDDLGIQKKLTGKQKEIERALTVDITATNDNEIVDNTLDPKNAEIVSIGGIGVKQVLKDSEAEVLTTKTPVLRIDGEELTVVDGELIVSKPTQIISKSSNLFDGLWELGTLNNNGVKVETSTDIRSVNFIKLTKGKQYIFKRNDTFKGIRFNFFELDGTTHIIQVNWSTLDTWFPQELFDSFNRDVLVKIVLMNTNDITTKAQLNEGTEALPYQPYAEHIYDLGEGVELPKLPNGVGDRWLSDGSIERKVGKSVISIYTMLTNYSPDFDVIYFELKNDDINYGNYSKRNGSIIFVDKEGYTWLIGTGIGTLRNDFALERMAIIVEKNRFTNLQEAKDFFEGTEYYYQLATPVIENAEPLPAYIDTYTDGTIIVDNSQLTLGKLYSHNCQANTTYFVRARLTDYTNAKVTNGTTNYPLVNGYVKFTPTVAGEYWLEYVQDGINKVSKAQWIEVYDPAVKTKTADELNALYSKFYNYGLTPSSVSKLVSSGDNWYKGEYSIVIPNVEYKVIGQDFTITFYDNDKNVISTTQASTFTTPNNCVYVSSDKNDIALYLSSNPITEYLPYTEDIVNIPTFEGLSLPNGVRNSPEMTRVGKVVFNGSENWNFVDVGTDTLRFNIKVNTSLINILVNNAISNHFPLVSTTYQTNVEGFQGTADGFIFIRILKNRLLGYQENWTNTQKINALKTWLSQNPLTIWYELANYIPNEVVWDKKYVAYNYGREELDDIAFAKIKYPMDFLAQVITNTDIVNDVKDDVRELENAVVEFDNRITSLYIDADNRLTDLETNKVDKEEGKSLVSNNDIIQITTNKNDIATINNTLNNKVDKVEGSRLITFDEANQIETNKLDIIDINNALVNKVDKVEGSRLITNDEANQIAINKTNIEILDTKIQALNGAKVFRGIINLNTSAITNANLTTRLTTIMGREPQLGDVLRDLDNVEWYYDGSTWNNYGQNIIGSATNSVEGVVQLGFDNTNDKSKLPLETFNKKAFVQVTKDSIEKAMGVEGTLFTNSDATTLTNVNNKTTVLEGKVSSLETQMENKANKNVVNNNNNGLMTPQMLNRLNRSINVVTFDNGATYDETYDMIDAGIYNHLNRLDAITDNSGNIWIKVDDTGVYGDRIVNGFLMPKDNSKQDRMKLLFSGNVTITKSGSINVPQVNEYDYLLIETNRTVLYIKTNSLSRISWLDDIDYVGGFYTPYICYTNVWAETNYIGFASLSRISLIPGNYPGFNDGTIIIKKVYGIKL